MGCAMGYEVLRFGSLKQVINDDDLNRLVQGMECLDRGMGRGECLMIKKHDQIKTAALIKGHSAGQAAVARSSGSNRGNQQLL